MDSYFADKAAQRELIRGNVLNGERKRETKLRGREWGRREREGEAKKQRGTKTKIYRKRKKVEKENERRND